MTDTVDTGIQTEVVQAPITNVKPYDDLEAYADETPIDNDTTGSTENITPTDETNTEGVEETPDAKTEEKPTEEAKAKQGDKVEDNFEKVVVEREINGKLAKFTIEEAIQAKVQQENFNREMDRRSTAISKKEKAWTESADRFKGNLAKLVETAQKGDFITAIRGIAKIAVNGTGLDPVKFEQDYFSQLDKVHDVYSKMSPEEQKAYWANRRAEEAEAKAKKLETEQEVIRTKQELSTHVQTLQQQYEIPEQEFWGTYKKVLDTMVGEGKTFQTKEDITPETVVDYCLGERFDAKIVEAGKKSGITNREHLNDIGKAILNFDPNMSTEEISKWIIETGQSKTAPTDKVENLNRKAGSSRFNQGSSTKKENGIPEGYDQETLDDLYRNQPKVIKRPVR
jgi:hypothetical protein